MVVPEVLRRDFSIKVPYGNSLDNIHSISGLRGLYVKDKRIIPAILLGHLHIFRMFPDLDGTFGQKHINDCLENYFQCNLQSFGKGLELANGFLIHSAQEINDRYAVRGGRDFVNTSCLETTVQIFRYLPATAENLELLGKVLEVKNLGDYFPASGQERKKTI